MITIADYLKLADWMFHPDCKQGRHDSFFWARLGHQVDCGDYVDLPAAPFRILLTSFDGSAPTYLGEQSGWRIIGDALLSDSMTIKPDPSWVGLASYMVLDLPLTEDEISSAVSDWTFDAEPESEELWKILHKLQPYYFVSYQGDLFFAARNEQLVQSLVSAKVFVDIEDQEREAHLKYRASLWQNLGPECGPEKCVEPACDRLRIKLAVRCFLHQIL